jgi:hypothetical protein
VFTKRLGPVIAIRRLAEETAMNERYAAQPWDDAFQDPRGFLPFWVQDQPFDGELESDEDLLGGPSAVAEDDFDE